AGRVACDARARSSAGQSSRLIIGRSLVRVQAGPIILSCKSGIRVVGCDKTARRSAYRPRGRAPRDARLQDSAEELGFFRASTNSFDPVSDVVRRLAPRLLPALLPLSRGCSESDPSSERSTILGQTSRSIGR